MSFRLIMLGALLGGALTAGAQTTAPAATAHPGVSLGQAMAAARDNLDVALSRRALEAARADVVTADHAQVPVVSLKASQIDLQNGVGGGNLLRDKRIDKAVGVDWTWERGNKRELRTRLARGSAEAAQADLEEVQVQQQLAAASAFYDLLAVQERIAHVREIQSSATQLSATAARRVRAGDLPQQEAMRTEIEAQRAGADLQSALAERQRAQAALALLTGMAPTLGADGGFPAPDAPAAQVTPAARADVRAAQFRVDAAQAALDGAVALRKSDVTLGSTIDHYPGTSNRLLEVRLQVPLNGVLGSYGFEGEIGRARAQLAQAQDQLAKIQRAADADVQRLQLDLQAFSSRAAVYQKSIVPQARQVAAMAELAYSKGALSLTDLIDARRTLRNALVEEVAARADHARALAAWQLRNAAAAP